MLFAASHLLVFSYVLHDAYIYETSCRHSIWGIYTMLNSFAYLCEHFEVALHLLPRVTVNAGHELVCAESVISLPVKNRVTTVRALAAESVCTRMPFSPVPRC